MVAIVVAICVGLLALGLAGLLTVFSVVAVAGVRVLTAAHEGGTWLLGHLFRRRTG